MTTTKEAIKALLDNATYGITIVDDSAATLAGHVYTEKWPGKQEFAAHYWIVTIGPVLAADSQLDVLGAGHKWTKESIQLDIWVMENRGGNYTAERVREDIKNDVRNCLHHYANAPGTGLKVVNLEGWRDLDEVGLKRTSCVAVLEYENDWA